MLNVYKTKEIREHLPKATHNPRAALNNFHVNKHHLVCGPTGTGKSNFLTNLILEMYDVFQKIHVYTLDADEPIYLMLKSQLKQDISFGDIRNVPSVLDEKAYPPNQGERLIVFDDFLGAGKHTMSTMNDYAISARKHNMTCCWLTQAYFNVPTVIRQQIRYLSLLKMVDRSNLNRIVCTLGIQLEATIIKKIIADATKRELNVCVIDLHANDLNKKFRRNVGHNEFYRVLDENGDEIPENEVVMFAKTGSGIVN
jgi:hypothetical protein